MGQKVHPIGLRVGVIRDWDSKWYAEKDFAANLHEDFKIREFISKQLKDASVSKVEIERFDKIFQYTLVNQVWLSVKVDLKSIN